MTNFEKIKSMNIDELSELIAQNMKDCSFCISEPDEKDCKNFKFCTEGIKKWLESEVENEY